MECYECGESASIPGDDGNHYCNQCWNGVVRKVVVAKYVTEDIFVIPDSINLEDESTVKDYYVKWGSLYIYLTDGRVLKILPYVESVDKKYPDHTKIEDMRNTCIEDIVGCDVCGHWEPEEDVVERDGKKLCSGCS
jgi:hypothetical protein